MKLEADNIKLRIWLHSIHCLTKHQPQDFELVSACIFAVSSQIQCNDIFPMSEDLTPREEPQPFLPG